ncbi:MAG: 16S rRNA (cytidine(1402)-2'-O)-methyltransferase [Bifidobacteriaceae bacterium]|jgi:16S rRNA (cytidine1402-2'-O)-methyltransferase|nr:16S rRNA (cytidine(1402)-2'-O)-methyltransferase [Bifidobacteriaceae bacterium]
MKSGEGGIAVGRVVVGATPIGNDADASDHLRELLAEADVVAAEDTRRARALAKRLGIAPKGRMVSLYDANEQVRARELVDAALEGATVLLVSDAGTPLVSDPGFRVVRLAAAEGVRVACAPGPSAVLAALAVSGLATDRFVFEGFWPRKAAKAADLAAQLATERRTAVFFVAARRLPAALTQMVEAWGSDRPAVVCRELTKVHEEIWRGSIGELAVRAAQGEVLGEVTLVVAGAPPADPGLAALAARVNARVAKGERLAGVVAEVAAQTGAPRRALYEAALLREGPGEERPGEEG